jgi:rhodanese-related sulfurtransferase
MAPFHLAPLAGTLGYDLVFLVIGLGFGAALEVSGFGDSRKLAAQFYLREMTVLKVMFTAIVVAAVLIFLSSALGLLDFSRVWVNPTYLAPGIVGGLIMGVGFIVGGFCPGTSLVAASTLKLDGVFFVLGVFGGVYAFGETVHGFEPFFQSTFLGRFTVADWLGLPHGVVVVLLVLMALAMFWAAGIAEAYFGAGTPWKDIRLVPHRRAGVGGAGVLVALAVTTAVLGQPTVQDRWGWIAPEGDRQIGDREVFVDPAEVVDLKKNISLRVEILEVRGEADFNRFHLLGARRMNPDDARDPAFVRTLLGAGDNTLVFLASNGEADATQAWKDLRAQGVLNLYVIAGGINGWLDRNTPSPCVAQKQPADPQGEALAWQFAVAVGDRCLSAHPDLARKEVAPQCALAANAAVPAGAVEHDRGHAAAATYVKKVKLQKKTVAKGGCG